MIAAKSTRSLIAALAGAMALTGLSMTPASAHEPYVREAPSPACETPALLSAIQSRFVTQARNIHHRPDWRIVSFDKIHEHRYQPQDVHKSRAIARRYCHATVTFNDHTHRPIWYLIEGGMGFAGFGQSWLGSREPVRGLFGHGTAINNVEFCIEGLDDWNVYNAHCRVLR